MKNKNFQDDLEKIQNIFKELAFFCIMVKKGGRYKLVITLFVIFLVMILFFGFIGMIISALFGNTIIETGNVAVIPIVGPIVATSSDDLFSSSSVAASSTIVENIEKANKDTAIEAIIVEINSPGGSPVASDEIAKAMERSKKPVVAVIREMGASGGYWIASSADVIVAHPYALVGSIGVIGSYLEFPDLLTRFNVSYNQLIAGKDKDLGTPYKHLDKDQQAMIQSLLDELHTAFINHVAEHRKLDPTYVREIATGWVYSGEQAKKMGLVDELGGRKEAIAIIEKDLNITAEVVEYKAPRSIFDLIAGATQTTSYNIGRGMGDSFFTKAEEQQTLQLKM